MRERFRLWAAASAAILAFAAAPGARAQAAAPAADSITEAIAGGHLLFDVRGRWEHVDQTRTAILTDDAEAYTVRTQLGWETAPWHALEGLLEFQDVSHLGPADYAVNAPGAATPPLNGPGKAKYPLIDDPDVVRLNRLQFAWAPARDFTATIGRQRIQIDDQRFIGDVGWRQNSQMFDAARADFGFAGFSGTYVYVDRVNRILGPSSDWSSDSHLLNLAYAVAPPLRLEGFLYALDFPNSAINNSITQGGRITGKAPFGPLQLAYGATYARQHAYRPGPAPRFDLPYWDADLAASWALFTGKIDFEGLGGDGRRGFTTPLATTHLFNGWADAWVSPGGAKSFVDGLRDLNGTLAWRPPVETRVFFNPELTAVYHAFSDDRTGASLAGEFDLMATASFTRRLTGLVKFADFLRDRTVPVGTAAPPTSRTKVGVGFEYRL